MYMAWKPGRRQKNNGRTADNAHNAAKKARDRDSDPTYWPDFGFIPPPAAPLPLTEAIRQLPEQYKRVVTRPYAETFLVEMGQAYWGIIWVHLLRYPIIAPLLPSLPTLIPPPT